MKKLLTGLLLTLGVAMTANAGFGALLTPVAPGMMIAAVISEVANHEYEACNDKPFVLVSHASNPDGYSFNVTQCEIDKNPGKFVK